jgi:hypothetical protein
MTNTPTLAEATATRPCAFALAAFLLPPALFALGEAIHQPAAAPLGFLPGLCLLYMLMNEGRAARLVLWALVPAYVLVAGFFALGGLGVSC